MLNIRIYIYNIYYFTNMYSLLGIMFDQRVDREFLYRNCKAPINSFANVPQENGNGDCQRFQVVIEALVIDFLGHPQ